MSVESTIRAYFEAFEASDSTALANLFTDDGVIAPLDMATISGQAAIKETFDGFFGAVSVRCEELTFDRIVERGDTAFVETHSTERVVNRETSAAETARFRELFCLQRGDGGWRVASYMFNH